MKRIKKKNAPATVEAATSAGRKKLNTCSIEQNPENVKGLPMAERRKMWRFLTENESERRCFFENYLPDFVTGTELWELAQRGFENTPELDEYLRDYLTTYSQSLEAYEYWLEQQKRGGRSA